MTANDSAALNAPPAESQQKILRSLPPFPAVALQLMGLLDSEVAVKQIVGLLRVDPALSGEILRVSNSALYGMSRQVETVSHAVVILGGDTVKRLALTVAMGRFSHQFMRHQGLRACWNHSVACAIGAEAIAELLYLAKDVAYTVGLLHDIGKFGLLAAYPEQYGPFLEETRGMAQPLERERASFGMDHCQVGGWLAREWNLPEEVREGIEQHHAAPEAGPSASAGMVAAVRAADEIVNAMGYSSSGGAVEQGVDEILERLPFPDAEIASQRIGTLSGDIERCLGAVSPRR